MATHEVSWSSFLREPSSIERWLEQGDVLLRRRDAEPLRLTRASSDASLREAVLLTVRLLNSRLQPGQLNEETIAQSVPWTRFLPEADRRTFAAELLATLEACADLGDFTVVGRLVTEWKNTARLHAEGIAEQLKSPLNPSDERPVRRP